MIITCRHYPKVRYKKLNRVSLSILIYCYLRLSLLLLPMITWSSFLTTKMIFLPHLSPWVPKSQSNRTKVVDFNTWLQAWCVFVRVYCRFHSHRVQEVLHYQTIMAQYGHQYVFPEFYLFDRQFRLRLANNNILRWDRFDFELVGRFLRTFRPVCFRCRNFGQVRPGLSTS